MLFVHDHTFIKVNGNYYTTGSLNQGIMDRYKKWFNEVTVFANYKYANEVENDYVKEENRVSGIKFELVHKNNSVINLLKVRKNIKNEVKKSDYIVIRMSLFGAIAAYYSKKFRKKYLIEMVACPWDSLWNHSIKGKFLAPIMTIITKYVCKNATDVLYVTNEFLQKRYPTYNNQIGCSDVELVNIENSICERRINRIDNYKEKDVLKLATVANISIKYKGQAIVIKALKELKKYGIRFEYYLIGGGKPNYIQKCIEKFKLNDCVHIVGPKPHNEIFTILDDIDIYIQPSYQEGLPRAVIEAMSRACPVFGTNTGGIPELINSECIFKRGDVKGLVKLLANIDYKKLKDNSMNNFEKSKEYERNFLSQKREKFYLSFKDY